MNGKDLQEYEKLRRAAKIYRYSEGGVYYAEEKSTRIIRIGKTEKEALTALENTLLSYPSYVLTEAGREAIPDALKAIKEAKEEAW